MQERTCAPLTRFDKSIIDEKDPWAGNLVPAREDTAKTLTRLFAASKGPYVVSVSSPWGTGKSDFLKRWESWLHYSEEMGQPCFRFNAWEHDYMKDPFLAFATALDQFVQRNPPTVWKGVKTKARKVAKSAAATVCKGLELVTEPVGEVIATIAVAGVEPANADIAKAGVKGAVTAAGESVQRILKLAAANEQNRKKFISDLDAFAQAVLKTHDAPFIIMVDELDRCKPTFAVALLETIKHLFCVQGIVFVLAIESNQIANCVSKIYGLEQSSAKDYLHKFIDLDIELPPMDMYTFLARHLSGPAFPLALPENEVHMRLQSTGPPVCSLDEWLAAILWDQLPTPRRALQVLNQISVLSARQDMDSVSLLACGYALSYRIRMHCSIDEAISKVKKCDIILCDITRIPQDEKNIIEYRNMFSSLMRLRFAPVNDTKYKLEGLLAQNEYGYRFLQEDKFRLWTDFYKHFPHVQFRRRPSDGGSWPYWAHGQGDDWEKYLKKCLTFAESIATSEPVSK